MIKRKRTGTKKAVSRKGKKTGEKLAFTAKQVEALTTILRAKDDKLSLREYAIFRIAIDTMLRSVDLMALTYGDVTYNGKAVSRFDIIQQKTGSKVTCLLTDPARAALDSYIAVFSLSYWDDPAKRIFPLSQRWYFNTVKKWAAEKLGLNPSKYGTHSLRRTKPKAIYATTGNLKAVQQLLGHNDMWHTHKYLGVEREDALDIAAKIVL